MYFISRTRVLRFIAGLLVLGGTGAPAQSPISKGPVYTYFYWENIGEVVSISKSVLVLKRTLRISNNSWSLESGAVSKAADLVVGDHIFAQGKTISDGTFDTNRIYLIGHKASEGSAGSSQNASRNPDFATPDANRPPTSVLTGGAPVGRGGGNLPGQVPTGTGTGSGPKPQAGEPLQDPRGSKLTRYHSWDADGVIESLTPETITITQSYFVDGETEIRTVEGNSLSRKELRVGQRLGVTVKDKVDEKNRAIKAKIIRVLPAESKG
jgi:hypothetical protein